MRLDKEIDMKEYLEIKDIYESVMKDLIRQQAELAESDEKLPKYAEESGNMLKQFSDYIGLDPKGKQLFLGSVLAEKLVFENNDFRTIKLERVIERISFINKGLQENKNGTSQFFIEKSHQVEPSRIKSNNFMKGMIQIEKFIEAVPKIKSKYETFWERKSLLEVIETCNSFNCFYSD